MILIQIWLSACGKWYFIVYDPNDDSVSTSSRLLIFKLIMFLFYQTKRYRARSFVQYHTANDQPVSDREKLSNKLDLFIRNGKKVERNGAPGLHESWVLEAGTSPHPTSEICEDFDEADEGFHEFFHYDDAVAGGVPRDWCGIGFFYTSVYHGIAVQYEVITVEVLLL